MFDTVALVWAARSAGVCTCAGYVWMMFAYFRPGPRKAGDGAMSTAALASAAAQFVGFLSSEQGPAWCYIACIVLLATSNVLFWSARAAHGEERPAAVFGGAVPAFVVKRGPYGVVRHPFYSAYLLAYLALAVAGGLWWQYVIVGILFILYNHAASLEERLLSEAPATAASYQAYKKQSWRWAPFLW